MTNVSRCDIPKVYAAKYKDRESTFKSTSGGLFIPIAKSVLSMGGVVFGCAYDENLVAKHIEVETEDGLYRLQSSKYVQSDTRKIYKQVKTELQNGKKVLFSGTGCQVAGLKAFLSKEYENLLTIDIVCHGVPSPKLFKNYIDYMGKKLGGTLTSYNFRSKEKRGWDLYYKAENAKKSKSDYGFLIRTIMHFSVVKHIVKAVTTVNLQTRTVSVTLLLPTTGEYKNSIPNFLMKTVFHSSL